MTSILDPLQPLASPARVATVLRAAADHLDVVGLHKGELFAGGGPTIAQKAAPSACCAMGAVMYANLDGQVFAFIAATDALDRHVRAEHADELETALDAHRDEYGSIPSFVDCDRAITVWNDAEERTKDDVVAVLRATALDVEAAAS